MGKTGHTRMPLPPYRHLERSERSFSFAVKKKMETLEIAMGLVGSYASCGISPQTDGMPVIPQKAANLPAGRFFDYDF